MNGLEIIDLQRGGFADRLFKRRPSENTFIEINNILASVPILQIDRQSITNKLDEYGINSDDAKPRFLSLYSQVLKHFIRDSDLSDQEIEELERLERLKNIFDLTPDVKPHYIAKRNCERCFTKAAGENIKRRGEENSKKLYGKRRSLSALSQGAFLLEQANG